MAEHGFLRPNPALFDLESRKRKPHLAHELGEGSRCSRCGDGCPGFQLHYWRKVCQNCKCGKAEHNVVEDEDPGFYFVGKIFDRPLRTRAEEMEFCYGNDSGSSSDEDELSGRKGRRPGGRGYPSSSLKSPDSGNRKKKMKKVRFEWIPPNISQNLARRYLEELPESNVPIAGSLGAQVRKKQLQKQFPKYDIEPSECHDLSNFEIESMQSYISNVKEKVVGQGIVMEVVASSSSSVSTKVRKQSDLDRVKGQDEEAFPPPPDDELLRQMRIGEENNNKPPPLPAKPPKKSSLASYTTSSRDMLPPVMQEGGSRGLGGVPKRLSPTGSMSSSSGASSRTNTPSPPTTTSSSGHDDDLAAVRHRAEPERKHGTALLDTSGVSRPVTKCMECLKPLYPGDVAVKADRAGSNCLWHPKCFKCSTCQEILVDLLYYFDSGRIFCARDYAEHAKIPRCAACDELIFAVEYTGAENKAWHIKHFCCYECDRPLAGHKYIPIDGQPHCLLCYQTKHGKICRTCGEYINPEEQRVSLQNDHWHAKPECFCCAICNVSLLGRKMTRKNDLILCSSACSRKASQMYANTTTSGSERSSEASMPIQVNNHQHHSYQNHHHDHHKHDRHQSSHPQSSTLV